MPGNRSYEHDPGGGLAIVGSWVGQILATTFLLVVRTTSGDGEDVVATSFGSTIRDKSRRRGCELRVGRGKGISGANWPNWEWPKDDLASD